MGGMHKPSARAVRMFTGAVLFGPFRNLAGEEYRRAFGVELGLGLVRSRSEAAGPPESGRPRSEDRLAARRAKSRRE
jgi:hypothetical protein